MAAIIKMNKDRKPKKRTERPAGTMATVTRMPLTQLTWEEASRYFFDLHEMERYGIEYDVLRDGSKLNIYDVGSFESPLLADLEREHRDDYLFQSESMDEIVRWIHEKLVEIQATKEPVV